MSEQNRYTVQDAIAEGKDASMQAGDMQKKALRKAMKAKLGLPEEFYDKLGKDISDGLRAIKTSRERYIKHRSEARASNRCLVIGN